jgi:hypothetical protein
MEQNDIKPGDKLYIPTALYIGHGADDIQGGIATVNNITISKTLPQDHYNFTFVVFEECPGRSYNLNYILENQDKWAKKYGRDIAHPDPDLRPEFNEE